MAEEVLVLVEQQRVDQQRRDLIERRPQSVLLVARQGQAQQATLRIKDRLGLRDACGERVARPEADRGERERRDQRNAEKIAKRAPQTENEDPQPQVVLAFGLRITNCAPSTLSL